MPMFEDPQKRVAVKALFDRLISELEINDVSPWYFVNWVHYLGLADGAQENAQLAEEDGDEKYTVEDEADSMKDNAMDDATDFIQQYFDEAIEIGRELDPNFTKNFIPTGKADDQ